MEQYNSLDKVLHRQFLGNNSISTFLFERLIKNNKKNIIAKDAKHIFISGLARCGSTSLLNKIHSSKVASILYSHMPFILSPKLANFYSKFSNEKNKLERFHGDNIFISSNSPECLDEAFWLKSDINGNSKELISTYKIKENTLNAYGNYLLKFSKVQKTNRLVIKNNNHHIRLADLSNYFKKSNFLILFREPLSHSISLLEQHKRFLELQRENPFILEYMNLIGHFEFGENKKPFLYDTKNTVWFRNLDDLKINYWITQWIETYSYIFESNFHLKKNIHLICYEDLCDDQLVFKYISKINNLNNIDKGNFFSKGKSNFKKDIYKNNFDKSLIDKAYQVYLKLRDISKESYS